MTNVRINIILIFYFVFHVHIVVKAGELKVLDSLKPEDFDPSLYDYDSKVPLECSPTFSTEFKGYKDFLCCECIKKYEGVIKKKLNESIWKECEKHYQLPTKHTQKMFTIGRNKEPWSEAIIHCEREGKHLATVKSAEEQKKLEEIMIRNGLPEKPWDKIWLAGNDYQEFGGFKWFNQTFVPFTYTNWDKNEPRKDLKDYRCSAANTKNFLWRRDKCTHSNWYACEYLTSNE